MSAIKDLSGGEKSGGADKKEQLLQIFPANELRFQGPFNQAITSHMRLSNPTDETILFKIKTTAPKKYCVRPNCGTLAPQASVEVSICLQPFVFDPSEKNKHKFMVQSLVALKDVPFEQQWKEVGPTQLMDSKLRCVFVMPVDEAQASPSNKAPAKNDAVTGGDYVYTEAITQTGTSESEQALLTAEVQALRAETLKLRMEAVQQQEEIQRLRDASGPGQKRGGGADAGTTAFQNPYQPPQLAAASPMTSPLCMVVMLIIAILSALLGKFAL